MSLKKLFGAQVKLYRNFRNMTQETLAELIEIDIRQLARIESGGSFATAETIEKISDALKISYKDLFDFPTIGENKNRTFDDIQNYKENYSKLNKLIKKIALSDDKTEYLVLSVEALEKKTSREKLKSILLGMALK